MSERLSNAIDMAKKPIALVATAAAFGGGYAAINKGGEGNPLNSPDAGAAALVGAENCDAMDGFKDLSTNFNPNAFGPEADEGINSGDDAEAYINANPFADATKIDKVSLAAFMSLATIPATKDATTLSTEYIKNFDSTLKAYNTQEDALEDAAEDCATTKELLDKSANYTDNFANDGEPIVRVSRAVEGGRTTMKFKKMGSLTLEGVEIALSDDESERTDSNGREYNGFPSLLITKEGVVYMKGVTVEPKPKAGEQPDKKKAKSGSKGDNNNATGQNRSSNGGGGSGTNTGEGGTGGGSDGCGPTGCGDGSTGEQINGNNGNTNNGKTPGSGKGESGPSCGGCGGSIGGGGGGTGTGTSCGGCGGGGTTTSTPTPGPSTSTPTGGGNETPPPASPPPTGGGGDTPPPATEPAKGEETGVPPKEECDFC